MQTYASRSNPIHHDLLMIQFDNKVTNATLVHYAALQMQFRDNLVNAATAQWTKFLLFFHFPRNFSEQDKAADLKLVTPKTCEISKQEIFDREFTSWS